MKILARTKPDKVWKLVESAAYDGEKELQKLLAESPSLISIQDVREGAGQLVVAVREFPLPFIGFIDLLAFSAEGDMTLIECKLASNPQIKREVIGQALEYGGQLWQMTYEDLDEKIRIRSGKSLAELMREALGATEWDEEAFRVNVETALEQGSFILMIVVDQVTDELSRIIRFVNNCGQPAFSFAALELRRFQSDQTEMLVPRVLGIKEASRENRRNQHSGLTTRDEFLKKCEPEIRNFFAGLLDIAEQRGHTIYWGIKGFSIRVYLPESDSFASIAYGYPADLFQVYFANLPTSDEQILSLRKEILTYGIFQEAPKTLSVKLDSNNIKQAKEAYELMLLRVEEIAKAGAIAAQL
jgi:hypothetical protein